MEQKFATEKQIALIQKLKVLLDNEEDGNIIDKVDLTKVTCHDASTIIEGLIGLKNEHRRLWYGQKLSYMLDTWCDDIYDTCEKYLTK